MMSRHKELISRARNIGVELSADEIKSFDDFEELINIENDKYNLVASADHQSIISHYIDSLSVSTYPHYKDAKKVLDIGSGAGFPGIPLKIVFPKTALVIVESRQKRAHFLELVITKLGLSGVIVSNQRVEEFGQNQKNREIFDIVLARAVASLNVLLEYAIPLLTIGGRFIAYKGRKKDLEIEEARPALVEFGAELEEVLSLDIEPGKDRSLVVIRKLSPTPAKYPRRQGMPGKRPIK